MTDMFAISAAAAAIEATCGCPNAILRTIGHPVIWIGALIDALDQGLNDPQCGAVRRRLRGIAALLVIVAAGALPAAAIEFAVRRAIPSLAWLLLGLITSSLLASRSLHRHVSDVGVALETGGLAAARIAVGHIVGRNPAHLDEAGVLRAAIESLAENYSDGVVAPAFWCVVAGLPGIAAYKAANTADSMIGHRNVRHADFGWAAARFDDVINLPPARLAAVWLIAAAALTRGASAGRAWRSVWRDARRHRSPNAGWPEAAMAGALNLRLAGPRVYGDLQVEDAWMGDGRTNATQADLSHALRLYRRACALQIAALVLLAAIARG